MINNCLPKKSLKLTIIKILPIVIFICLFFTLLFLTIANKYEPSKEEISNNVSNNLSLSSPQKEDNEILSINNIVYTELKPIKPISRPMSENEFLEFSSKTYDEKLNILNNKEYNLEDRIKVFLSDDLDNIGLIYYNLDTGENISINEDESFVAASVYKVGLNMYTYYLANNRQVDLNDIVYYHEGDFEGGSGILQNEDYIGGRTVQELLDLSIIHSDNISSNMLWRYLGGYYNFKYNLYDLLDVNYDVIENNITPNIEFKILKYIYDNRNNDNFAHMIDTMKNTIFNDRITKYIPQDIVAHKIGDYGGAANDVGIVFTDSPYILIIFTDLTSDSYEKIGQVSKAIYDYNIFK